MEGSDPRSVSYADRMLAPPTPPRRSAEAAYAGDEMKRSADLVRRSGGENLAKPMLPPTPLALSEGVEGEPVTHGLRALTPLERP